MRCIYFFLDVPHLMKTIRFFFFILDVEEGQDSRGIKVFFLFWSHIARILNLGAKVSGKQWVIL